ncbi:MAG: hypothetical protein IKE01_01885 [Clostridia bacterium]|nr:hypothetical protein [Clostridia bacterium]
MCYVFIEIVFGWHFMISSDLEIKIPLTAKISCVDSHGGFHMDGETKAEVYFNEKQAQKFVQKIKDNGYWNKLPMNETLQKYINRPPEEEMSIPIINKGYWYLIDRNNMAANKHESDEIFDRVSRNYTVAIYDTDSNKLYYFREDT